MIGEHKRLVFSPKLSAAVVAFNSFGHWTWSLITHKNEPLIKWHNIESFVKLGQAYRRYAESA